HHPAHLRHRTAQADERPRVDRDFRSVGQERRPQVRGEARYSHHRLPTRREKYVYFLASVSGTSVVPMYPVRPSRTARRSRYVPGPKSSSDLNGMPCCKYACSRSPFTGASIRVSLWVTSLPSAEYAAT